MLPQMESWQCDQCILGSDGLELQDVDYVPRSHLAKWCAQASFCTDSKWLVSSDIGLPWCNPKPRGNPSWVVPVHSSAFCEFLRFNDLNAHLVKTGRAYFHQGSSDRLPFQAKRFDKVLAVHTLYFWEKPADHLAEICRVMKPSSRFCMAFGDRSFMKDLPFAPYGFRLYDEAEAIALLRCSGFQILEKCQYQEKGLSNTGDPVDKFIHIVVCGV